MSNVRPVGINSTLSTSTSSVQTSAFQQQSDSVRILAEDAGVYVATGPNPTATNETITLVCKDLELYHSDL